MKNSENNPFLKAATLLSEELKKESLEVQKTARDLSRKIYPEEWKARGGREERDS